MVFMYPADYFILFPPFPRDQRVLVAMSFDSHFQDRWEKVIEPAIQELGFEPNRVDGSRLSNSIMDKVLQGIGKSRLIFADISSVSGIRNPNVMYEVGMAHATRLKEEVVLFRTDNDKLPFDVHGINVNQYDPFKDIEGAKRLVKDALEEAIRGIETQKHLAVERATEAMDETTIDLLFSALLDELKYPQLKTFGQVLGGMNFVQGLSKLHERNLISTKYNNLLEFRAQGADFDEAIKPKYGISEFGKAVIKRIFEKQGQPLHGWKFNTGHNSDAELAKKLTVWKCVLTKLNIPFEEANFESDEPSS